MVLDADGNIYVTGTSYHGQEGVYDYATVKYNPQGAEIWVIRSVTGDIPYSSSEEGEMQQQIAEHNLYSPSEFFVHIGDIKSGSGSCSESIYQNVKNYLLQLQVPTFITPGDNEWIDCSNPPQAWNFWVQYFMNFEQNFCPVPGFQKQSVRPENFAWVQKGVLLIGISMPGGSEGTSAKSKRLQDDANWVSQQFQSRGSQVRAAVIFAHNMDESADALFINQFVSAANSFGKPILYIHGSGHSWIHDNPLSANNVLRVQVDNGGAALPVQVTVTTNNPATFMFNRNPWNSNSQPVNRPPCGQSSAPAIAVNPSAHDYGQVAVGSNSSQTFVVSNAGNASLEVTNTTLTGGNASDFGIVNGGGSYILSPGQTRNVVVRFNPGSQGDKSTTLRFESNDPNSSTKNVSLTGTGITTTAQFTLTTNVLGEGSVGLDPSGGTYDESTVVTVTAIPAAGFVFSGWSGDLSGPNNPMTITMDANKSVTATFEPSDPGGSSTIVHEETQTGGSTGSASVTTSASLIGVSGRLYLAAISNRSNRSVSSVSGLGLTWTRVKAQCSTRDRLGLEVWKAQGTPSGNGAVTAIFSAAPDNAAIAVSRYSGVDAANPIGNLISGNLNGVNGTCSSGSESNAYSFNLTTTTSGVIVYGAISMRQETHTPGAGYTERADRMQGSGSNAASVAVEDKSPASTGTAIVNGSFSNSVYWAVIGLELKPQSGAGPTQYTLTMNTSGSGSVTLNPPDGIYNSGATVQLTATPAAGFQFSGWSGDLTGSTNPATITMNGNKTVNATFTAIPPTQYTLTVTTSGSGSVTLNPPGG
ncbi:MAG: InlB B-repeat-containing protein, partial [bacterium]